MSEQKIYANSMWFEEKTFSDGGSIIKVNIKADELTKFLKENKNEDGYVKLVISKKKTIEEGKSTHYAYLDQWKPSQPQAVATKPVTKTKKVVEPQDEELV